MDAQQRAQDYRFMTDTVGFRDLEQHIRDRAADHRSQLMTCKTWEEALENRHKAEALESVLSHIQEIIQKGVEEDGE